jgi:hypothetical protein
MSGDEKPEMPSSSVATVGDGRIACAVLRLADRTRVVDVAVERPDGLIEIARLPYTMARHVWTLWLPAVLAGYDTLLETGACGGTACAGWVVDGYDVLIDLRPSAVTITAEGVERISLPPEVAREMPALVRQALEQQGGEQRLGGAPPADGVLVS